MMKRYLIIIVIIIVISMITSLGCIEKEPIPAPIPAPTDTISIPTDIKTNSSQDINASVSKEGREI